MRRSFLRVAIFLLGLGCFSSVSPALAAQKLIGATCSGDASALDWNTLAQCNGTTFIKAPLLLGAVAAPPYADTLCDSAKAGMLQWTGTGFLGCNGSSWSGFGSGSIAGYEIITNSCAGATDCAATCSTNKKVLGGGCWLGAWANVESAPTVSGNAWHCIANSSTASETVYAVCAYASASSTGAGYLGDSAANTAPSRTDDVTTGLFSDTASTVSISTAGTERLRVTATGSVGIGVTSPTNLLSVGSNGNSGQTAAPIQARKAGNSLEWGHPNSAGYATTLGAWAGGGQPFLCFSCEAGTTSNTFRTRGIKGSLLTSTLSGDFLFGVVPTASADNQTPTFLATLTSAGNVGIGTTSPTTPLHLYTSTSTDATRLRLEEASSAHKWDIGVMGSGVAVPGGFGIADMTAGLWRLMITATGSVAIGTYTPAYTLHVNGSVAGTSAYNNLSDARMKKDVTPLPYGLAEVMKMRPIGFNWIDQDQDWKKQHQIGLIAQEVEPLVPEVVTTATDEKKTKSIAYGSLVPVLIKALQELQSENESLRQALKTQEDSFNARLEKLEQRQ